jgi:hypothetical protein
MTDAKLRLMDSVAVFLTIAMTLAPLVPYAIGSLD